VISHLEGACQAKKIFIEKFFDFSLFMRCGRFYQCRFFIRIRLQSSLRQTPVRIEPAPRDHSQKRSPSASWRTRKSSAPFRVHFVSTEFPPLDFNQQAIRFTRHTRRHHTFQCIATVRIYGRTPQIRLWPNRTAIREKLWSRRHTFQGSNAVAAEICDPHIACHVYGYA